MPDDYSLTDVSPTEWRRLFAPVGAVWIALLGIALWRGWPGLEPGRWPWRVVVVVAPMGWLTMGLVVLPLAGIWEGLWLRRWEHLAAASIRHRRSCWADLQERATVAEDSGDKALAERLAARRNRLALAEPQCAHWIAERWAAMGSRVDGAYGLDAVAAWPRLWLLLPEPVRGELRRAEARWHRACVWVVWAALFGLLGLVWWPMLVVGVALWLWAYHLGRRGIAYRAELVEAAFDTHAVLLAEAMGVRLAVPKQLDRGAGKALMTGVKKGA